MNKIAASFSLLALGASCLHSSAEDSYISGDPGKIWNVSATLRGFYDDNRNTAQGSAKQEAFGYSVEPAARINWERDQNTLILGYKYALIYYDHAVNGLEKYNHNHFANLEFDHVFSERYQLKVTDSFSMAQEEELLPSPNNALHTTTALSGNNFGNNGAIVFNAEVTPLFGAEIGYQNAIYDYGSQVVSATLDRMEQSFHIDGRWNVLPETVAVLGYQYSMVDYTRNYAIPPFGLPSDSRNNRSHYAYVGADQVFTPDLTGSIRGGARITDYYKESDYGILGVNHSDVAPYVRLGLGWTYAPESSLSAGFSYDRNATDISSLFGSEVRDEQSATVFATLKHRIVPNLFASLNLQYQHSSLRSTDSTVDGKTEQIYLAGVNLQYAFMRHLSAEVGYDYDKVDSQLGRSYDRNRVYVGITGSY